MAQSIRLKPSEEKAIAKKCLELNRQLINKNQKPIRESELIHIILEQATEHVHLDGGEIRVI